MKFQAVHRRAALGSALAGLTLAGGLFVTSAAGTAAHPAVPTAQNEIANQETLAGLSRQFRHVAEIVEPSVVHVEVRGEQSGAQAQGQLPQGIPDELFRRFFGQQMPEQDEGQQGGAYRQFDVPQTLGAGSGWIFDTDGHVVTNNHVVADAEEVIVKTLDGEEHHAEIVATDPSTDVAVLKIDAKNLVPATVSTESVEQGDIVFAFGSPLQIEFSMSQGIVAGKGRRTGILGPQGYESFIQTDAAINPGNSGGPLTDIYGRVVGMNSAILTRSGFFSGIGFAIPSSMIEPVVQQLIANGEVRRGYLGVSIQDDPNLLNSFGYKDRGVLISDVVSGEAAAKAGLERGDIVTRVNGQPVATSDELRRTIASEQPGTVVKLALVRNGQEIQRDVALGEMPEQAEAGAQTGSERNGAQQHATRNEPLLELGIVRSSALTPQVARRAGIEHVPGVLVEEVRPQSVAAQAGIEAGSVITEIGDVPVASTEELADALGQHDLKRGVRLTMHVEEHSVYVFLKLPD